MTASWHLSNVAVLKLSRFAAAAGLTPDELVDEALALWMLKNCGVGACPSPASSSSDCDSPPKEGAPRWDDLTGAIFQYVYRELQGSSGGESIIGNARLVCRSWAGGLAANCSELRPTTATHSRRCIQKPFGELFPNLHTLDLTLHPYFGRRAEDLDALRGLNRLRSLSFKWWGELSPDHVALVSSLPSLSSCRVVLKTKVSRGTLQALSEITAPLALEWCVPDEHSTAAEASSPEEDVRQLMEIGSLTDLSLQGSCGYFEEAEAVPPLCTRLGLLGPVTALRSLVLARQSICDEQIAGLSALTGLRLLDLRDCCNVSDRGLAPLGDLKHLETLNLSAPGYGGPAGDGHLEVLRPLRAVTSLDLTGRVTEVTDAGLRALEGMTGLTSLALTELRRISHLGLESISRLTRLRHLNLELCSVSSGFSALESLTDMRALGLSTCAGLTDGALLDLCVAMTRLRAIDLSFTGIEQFGCHALGLCHDLAAISLEGTLVTDDGILSLAGLTSLRYLNLQSCRNLALGIGSLVPLDSLTQVAVYMGTHTDSVRADAFKRLIPSCQINLDPVSFSIEDYFDTAASSAAPAPVA